MTYIAVIKHKGLNHNCFVAIIITNIKHSSLTKHFRRFRTIDIIYMLFSFYLNLCCSFRKKPGSSSGSSKIEKVREKSNQISHSVSLGITRAINNSSVIVVAVVVVVCTGGNVVANCVVIPLLISPSMRYLSARYQSAFPKKSYLLSPFPAGIT